MNTPRPRTLQWLSPIVYLSNNVLSLIGVVLVTTAAVFWLVLIPTLWNGTTENPYMGILVFLALPTAFVGGLILIPAGMMVSKRRKQRAGVYPATFPALDLRNVEFRRLLAFMAVTTIINVIIAGQLTYAAVNYMDSVQFCGQTCHTVMKPEFTAYQNSPHSRVECVKCHIGPGAGWFVRSKLSGVGQVVAVAFNTYPRPIPTPVHNLRPARETCETCHWPQKFGGDRLRVIDKFADDETNTHTKSVLLMRVGGGNAGAAGIHGAHLGAGVVMRYAPADESRQTIPVVEYTKGGGKWVRFVSSEAKPAEAARLSRPEAMRVMDCMDCHNRPSHTYQLPERALDIALANGEVSPSLPFARKQGLELLKASYSSERQAADSIARGFEQFYETKYPAIYSARRVEIRQSATALAHIYGRNVFPEMNVKWGSYPNNLGHNDFPGCFRCHDGNHVAQGGQSISQDCGACHSLLAMDEANPKVLTDLGLIAAPPDGSTQAGK